MTGAAKHLKDELSNYLCSSLPDKIIALVPLCFIHILCFISIKRVHCNSFAHITKTATTFTQCKLRGTQGKDKMYVF